MNKKEKIVIELDIKAREDYFSKYNTKTLSPDVKNYLINELVGYDIDEKLTLKVVTSYKLNNSEKEEYELALRKEFRETIMEINYMAKSEYIRKLILVGIGVSFMICSVLFSNIEILRQVMLIFGWFALGQVAYAIFFTDFYRRREIKRLMQILISDMEFKEYGK